MGSLSGLLPLSLICLLVGVLIGCIGIGGVLLVPALTYIGGMEIRVAIASCMFSYLFSGTIGVIEYTRRGSIRWSLSGWLCAGAMPGAFLGAATVSVVPGAHLEILIATLIIFSGVHALLRPAEDSDARLPGGPWLAVIGAVVGYGSAMSGTGGPLLLVPILVWLKVPVLGAVGLSQVIQLPVATLATAGNLAYGSIDFAVGLGIAVLLMAGVAVGARIAHWVPAEVLRRIVALVLLVIGVLILTRLTMGR